MKYKFTIDMSGRGGLADKYFGDNAHFGYSGDVGAGQPNLRYDAKDGQMVSGIFNPNRRKGYLYPSPASISSITSGSTPYQMVATEYDSVNNRIYFLEYFPSLRDPKIMRLDSLTDTSLSDAHDLPAGAGPCSDLAMYYINGVKTMFYTYNKSSEWRVGKVDIPTGTYVDLWLGTGGSVSGTFAPSGSGEMKLIPSGNGYMYILNANSVHKVDGTTVGGANGTIEQDVLLGPTGYRFSHGVDYRNNLYIVVQKNTYQEQHASYTLTDISADCGVYIWNRSTTGFSTSDFIPVWGVREIRSIYVSPKGDIRIICVSSEGLTQIRKFNGSSFITVKELGPFAYPNFEDSLVVLGSYTVWGGKDGLLYYHGTDSTDSNSLDEILFVAGQVGTLSYYTSAGSYHPKYECGPMFFGGAAVSGTAYRGDLYSFKMGYSTYSDNTTIGFSVGQIYPFGDSRVSSLCCQGDVYSPVKILPRLSTIENITIYMAPAPVSGTSTVATIKLYANQSTTSFMSKAVTNNDIAKGYLEIEVNKPYVNAIQLEVEWSTSETLSNDNFAPSVAIVEYDTTNDIK